MTTTCVECDWEFTGSKFRCGRAEREHLSDTGHSVFIEEVSD